MRKIFLGLVTLVLALFFYATPVHAQQATTPVHSSGGPGGAAHRMPHDVAFSAEPSTMNPQTSQGQARTTLTNWVNTKMTRLVCVEAFNTASSARTHLGCLPVNFDMAGTNMSSYQFDVPLGMLPTGTHRLVYTYQDSAGFWHQVTNTSDDLVTTTFTR